MAFGQIDPARLEGDALKQWYLRSPAQIEEERRQAAAGAYDSFSRRTKGGQSPRAPAQQQEDKFDDYSPASWEGRPTAGQYQLAAAPPRGFWDYWGIRGCQNCHGYTPGTLPPYGGGFPSGYSPRSGGGSGGSARPGDKWSDRPQCNQQFEADRKICQTAKSSECWQNQNKRLWHCSTTGEVGTPPLKFGPPRR